MHCKNRHLKVCEQVTRFVTRRFATTRRKKEKRRKKEVLQYKSIELHNHLRTQTYAEIVFFRDDSSLYVCMYVCMDVCMYVCMCVCLAFVFVWYGCMFGVYV
jgi:hypothetical protein